MCRGLLNARIAVLCALPLLVFLLSADLLLSPLVRPKPFADAWGVFQLLPALFLILIPVAAHALGQISCARVAPFPGSHAARRSLELQAGAFFVLVGFSFIGPALIVLVVLLLVGVARWLTFLDRLARNIDEDDHALVAAVRSARGRYWTGLGMLFGLFVGTVLATVANNWHSHWLCRAGASVLALVLLVDYTVLLQKLAQAIARRAPASPPASAPSLTPSA